jgi:hypothetical protein
MPEEFYSSAIGIHDESVFRIHKNEYLPEITAKLIKAISLFSLAKPINYPSLLNLFSRGLTIIFLSALKKESDYSKKTAKNMSQQLQFFCQWVVPSRFNQVTRCALSFKGQKLGGPSKFWFGVS